MKRNRIPLIYTSILYICGFLLFLEWLYPIGKITDTESIDVFIIYTIFCFLISLFQVRWWLSFLLKGLGLLFILHGLYMEEQFLTGAWFAEILQQLSYNIQLIFSAEWYEFTAAFRSMLFLLLIWLMSYLIHYWFIVAKRLLLFSLLTIVYLAVLDTFTLYNANFAIVRTFIFAFFALGMANLFKEVQRRGIHFSWSGKNTVWMVPLLSVVLFSTVVGYAAPKFAPQWPDPLPFVKGATTGSSSDKPESIVQKVGYGEDDTRLGGAFVQDYTKVFQAAVKEEHYWRIETKDFYTGKGWEVTNPETDDLIVQPGGHIDLRTFSEDTETEALEAILDFQGERQIPKLLYPYGVREVQADPDVQFLLNPNTEDILIQQYGHNIVLDQYTIFYDNPTFSINDLREANETDPKSIKTKYTQLPKELPERVHDLAMEITASETNRFDKVRAIERYFGRNGFRYQITDVAVPGDDEDYVDQFLFETKVGYCDNYSTSMVVMLRTLGIPARWVKGFTSGVKISDHAGADSAFSIYEVTNANAHSWVEAYFPEVGWVPFEPTQGFDNPASFQMDSETEEWDDAADVPVSEMQEPEEPEETNEPAIKEEEPLEQQQDPVLAGEGRSFHWPLIAGMGVMAIAALYALYHWRFKWKTLLMGIKLKRRNDARTYQEAYHHVLKMLAHHGLPKDPDQTLREYAKRIDARYDTESMGVLTNMYERVLYNEHDRPVGSFEIIQLWKNLIKRITA